MGINRRADTSGVRICQIQKILILHGVWALWIWQFYRNDVSFESKMYLLVLRLCAVYSTGIGMSWRSSCLLSTLHEAQLPQITFSIVSVSFCLEFIQISIVRLFILVSFGNERYFPWFSVGSFLVQWSYTSRFIHKMLETSYYWNIYNARVQVSRLFLYRGTCDILFFLNE